MQEHTNKDQETSRGRSSPIHLVPTSRAPGANAEALRDVHMSLVRAEQNLYNLVQASQANGQAAYGFTAPAPFAAGYAAPAFPPGFAPGAPLVTPPGLAYGFQGHAGPWANVQAGAMAPWTPLSAGIAALPALGTVPGLAPAWAIGGRTPACDISDEGKQFVCLIDLPGLRADQVELLCFEHAVVINASREVEGDSASLVQSERATAIQQRTITLPNEIQPGGAKATLSNGILTVTLPKVHPTEGPRRIKVQG